MKAGLGGTRGWGLTRGRILPEGVVHQREVQHRRGVGAIWVQEQVALARLALLLRAGRDGREWDALLPTQPAQKLQLLHGRKKGVRGQGPWGLPSVSNARPAETPGRSAETPGTRCPDAKSIPGRPPGPGQTLESA